MFYAFTEQTICALITALCTVHFKLNQFRLVFQKKKKSFWKRIPALGLFLTVLKEI
jgi:hypothetical protein